MNRGQFSGMSEEPNRQPLYYDGTGNLIIGYNAAPTLTEQYGAATTPQGANNIVIGDNAGAALTAGYHNVILGVLAGSGVTSGTDNVILGYNTVMIGTGAQDVVIGSGASATVSTSVAIGYTAWVNGAQGTAVGNGATAGGSSGGADATAVGANSNANSGGATALGEGAAATATSATAIGIGSSTAVAHEIKMGTAAETVNMPGGIKAVVKSVTTTYAMAATDFTILASASAGYTVTLPAPSAGAIYRIKNMSTGNTVTVSQHASETIDGAATVALSSQYEAIEVTSDGTNWMVVGQVATTIL